MNPTLLLLACLTEPPADSGSDSTPTTDSTPTETGGTETGGTPTVDTAHTEAGCPVFPVVEGVRLVGAIAPFSASGQTDGEWWVGAAESEAGLVSLLEDAGDHNGVTVDREAFGDIAWELEGAMVGWYTDGWYRIPFGVADVAEPAGSGPVRTEWCMSNDTTHFETSSTSIQVVAYPREWGTEVEATLTVIE